MSDEDSSGAYSLAQQAQSLAERALDVAQDALSEARDAAHSAARAQDSADEALRRIEALRGQVETLEEHVEQLIRMLEEGIRTLIERTEAVERTIEAQSTALQEKVEENTRRTEEGFSTALHQEVEAKLLESASTLKGLESRLTGAGTALQGEYDQARRRGDEQKERFAIACRGTVESLNRDLARLGALILQIKDRDFGGTVERRVESLRSSPGVIEVARSIGKAALQERAAAIAPHLSRLDVDLGSFAASRQGLLSKIQPFIHRDLGLESGEYALRVYFATSGAASQCVVGADVQAGDRTIQVQKATSGLGRLEAPFLKIWEVARAAAGRTIDDEERGRLRGYLQQLHGLRVLSDSEYTVINQHVERAPIEIRNPSTETQP